MLLTSFWLYLISFISSSAGWNSHVAYNFHPFVVFTASTGSFFPKINLIYGLTTAADVEEWRKDRKEKFFCALCVYLCGQSHDLHPKIIS